MAGLSVGVKIDEEQQSIEPMPATFYFLPFITFLKALAGGPCRKLPIPIVRDFLQLRTSNSEQRTCRKL
jgi:hypothetical protein